MSNLKFTFSLVNLVNRISCTFVTAEEQAVLALYRHIPDRTLCHKIIYHIFSVIAVGKQLLPEGVKIVEGSPHQIA